MPAGRPRFLERTAQRERRRQRLHIVLHDASISERTQERYYNAVRELLPVLESVGNSFELDDAVAD